ncbi:MAG TPA: arsenite methyltransferase [Gemmatimonadales bacterium]|nr:arsenite methyltransferase [Gemmatimonadales bacterium]
MSPSPDIKHVVREKYGEIAKNTSDCGCAPSCCGGGDTKRIGEYIGYDAEALAAIPEGANLGLGCGNPLAHAAVKPGEVVLDLGSGAGMDAFLAAREVGPTGKVIGVDMTPDMIERARENASKAGVGNVEFRLGEIERLPAADASVDLVISNCVINLSPDKPAVFAEAFRVLKPGGRMVVSDLVLKQPLSDDVRHSVEAYVGCVAGASLQTEYLALMRAAGFERVETLEERSYGDAELFGGYEWLREAARSVVSAKVRAIKPLR